MTREAKDEWFLKKAEEAPAGRETWGKGNMEVHP